MQICALFSVSARAAGACYTLRVTRCVPAAFALIPGVSSRPCTNWRYWTFGHDCDQVRSSTMPRVKCFCIMT
ncbi:hypothetical protein DENSPDRAFT_76298 [Dentipellis sp. KUC8613]|nr:hypothetical protein DENSPDRAFT_76298 [Dentipellis sp. KUC8613]